MDEHCFGYLHRAPSLYYFDETADTYFVLEPDGSGTFLGVDAGLVRGLCGTSGYLVDEVLLYVRELCRRVKALAALAEDFSSIAKRIYCVLEEAAKSLHSIPWALFRLRRKHAIRGSNDSRSHLCHRLFSGHRTDYG